MNWRTSQYEIEKRWQNGELDVTFHFGDKVRFRIGEFAGKTGRIVALISLDPAPLYVIEFPEGHSGNGRELELVAVQA